MAKIINMTTIARPIRNPTSCARSDSGRPRAASIGIEQKMTAIEQRIGNRFSRPIETDSTAVKIDQRAKPSSATSPEIWAIRIGPPI